MSYNYTLEDKVTYSLYMATLSISSYATDEVFSVSSATGNLSLTVNSGVITLPAGRYMCQAFPHVDVATTSDVIKFTWQQSESGSYSAVGLEGQIQVIGDTVGERDSAIAVIDELTSTDIRLILSDFSSSGTPADEGGYLMIWKEVK